MAKPRLHIYGNYMGDIKVTRDVLKESNEYNVTHEYYEGTDNKENIRPKRVDYLISANRNPTKFIGKIIHTHHGLGCVPKLLNLDTTPDLGKRYRETYYALCVYGKVFKSWYDELGFPSERILTIGMPASVELLLPINMQKREKFLCDKGLDPAKKTVLYGPSWGQGDERELFYLWWQDGKEASRVDEFCKFITQDLSMNLIVRLHNKARYSEDWIAKYSDIFRAYGVNGHYLGEDSCNLPHLRYSDVLVGDSSSMNTYFYVMDKPVVHIATIPLIKKLQRKWGGIALSDRAGYIIDDFQDLLDKIEDSVENPSRFSDDRKRTIKKYVDYVGEASREAILSEFRRFIHDDMGR